MHAEEDPLGCQEGSSQVRMREVTGWKNIPEAARTEAEARGMSMALRGCSPVGLGRGGFRAEVGVL